VSSKATPAKRAAKVAKLAPTRSAQPRLRVLAGPNGSGKSTIKSDLRPQWIGVFLNADELEKTLRASKGTLNLRDLGVTGDPRKVLVRIKKSIKTFGLNNRFDMPALLAGITLNEVLDLWIPGPYNSYLAATLAEAVRQELLDEGKTFTFETVMSHRSKIDFMLEARKRGYRVYPSSIAFGPTPSPPPGTPVDNKHLSESDICDKFIQRDVPWHRLRYHP
jgi:predicted ABC-type ATPase